MRARIRPSSSAPKQRSSWLSAKHRELEAALDRARLRREVRRGAHHDHGVETLGRARREVQEHVAASGETDGAAARDAERVEEGEHVVGGLAVGEGALQRTVPAVAAQVGHDDAAVAEVAQVGRPVGGGAEEAVEEQERRRVRVGSGVVIVVQLGGGAHAREIRARRGR